MPLWVERNTIEWSSRNAKFKMQNVTAGLHSRAEMLRAAATSSDPAEKYKMKAGRIMLVAMLLFVSPARAADERAPDGCLVLENAFIRRVSAVAKAPLRTVEIVNKRSAASARPLACNEFELR